MRYLLISLLLILVSVASSAIAQDDSVWIPRTPEKKVYSPSKLFEQLPKEIQKEILDETEMVYQKCQETSGSLTQILDCRCISLKFLDKRVLDGPNTPQHLVVQGIDTKDCKSDAGIAGMMYDMCIQNFWFISGYEGMCECATKKATPNVMKYDIATERAVAVQMAEAMQACDPNWLTNGLLNKGTGSGTQQNSNQFQPPPKPQ